MRPFDRSSDLDSRVATLTLTLATLLAGCSSGNDSIAFELRTSSFVGTRGGATTVTSDLGIFMADEATQAGGVDLNDDGDTLDAVAVAVRFDDLSEQLLGAAATEVAIVGASAFLVVDEAGNRDWNENMLDERVLLRWDVGAEEPIFIAVLDPDSPRGAVAASGRVFWALDSDPVGAGETNLRYVDALDVTNEFTVVTDGVTLAEGRFDLLGTTGGVFGTDRVVVVGIDETDPDSPGDSNGDGDDDDEAVLALIDAGVELPVLVGSGLAMPSKDAPVEALFAGDGQYDVGFLVSESEQAGTNLNGSMTPSICGAVDVDTADDVLHHLRLDGAEILSTTNTTLAGAGRVYLVTGFLGTLCPETAIGPSGCDLTNDGMTDDTVLRFAPLDMPDMPVDLDALYLPIDTAIAGGTSGVTGAGARFVGAIDDEFAVTGGLAGVSTLAQFDPLLDSAWEFDHADPDPQFPSLVLSIQWMGEFQGGRVPVQLLEEQLELNLNRDCGLGEKDNGVPDQVDAIPGVLRLPLTGPGVASGYGWAVAPNAAQQVAFGAAFFGVVEADDGFDWNADGDTLDTLLFRSPLLSCSPVQMAQIESSLEAPIVTDGARGAFLYTSEADTGEDLNGDGLVGGLAVRYFSAF